MIPQPDNIYCKYCNTYKTIDCFTASSLKKPYPKCILCVKVYNNGRKEQNKKYRKDNEEKLKEQSKRYYQENKEIIKLNTRNYAKKNNEKVVKYQKNYYEENKDTLLEYQKEYYINNSEHIKDRTGAYYKNNKKEILEKIKKYINNRRKIDPEFKLRERISNTVGKLLKSTGFSKNGNSILKYISYSIIELKQYLESQFEPWMNWNNHGVYNAKTWNDNDSSTWTWNIDHIIPQSKLLYASMKDENFKKCWALENLRPYSAKQNIIDGSRR